MSTSPLERSLEQRLGLRERKKLKTRRSIQEHALRLFQDQGYDATTVEQIAEAAEVSPSTFFRYFPTKEDTVLTDEYDPFILEAFRAQPPELSPAEALRNVLHDLIGDMLASDRQRILDRSRLMLAVPALRARQWEQTRETQDRIVEALADRLGRPAGDFELRAFGAAVIAVWETAILAWVEDDGEDDILELLDRGLDYLTAGCPL
ncbi:acyl-CoA-like ligand-binding transcription factor [Actinoallomurus rhizosphaericola]|uniref:acyl-CoA-like ligand-binding transcription factor n=1 Tax=Actinoallomurus rhizosphaericola TaxID=2952536 RepID=UPI002091D430|nr:TetR family transcriptional regulator [Actinoallomurus rhizosphaericola]MCO5992723.1 TetR family transcriptional regulator [Actinoallomurus rhizosphaericola]